MIAAGRSPCVSGAATWGMVASLLVGACSRPENSAAPPASGIEVARSSSSAPIVLPPLDDASESVRAQILEQQRVVAASANDSPEQRAAAHGALGKLLMAGGYLAGAEDAFSRARNLNPADRRWTYYLAHVYRLRNEPARAAALLDASLASAPSDVATLTWLGEMHVQAGNPAAAEPVLARALELAPDNPAVLAALGRLALLRGDPSGAITRLTRALELQPRATSLHYPLAMAYQRTGDPAKASDHLRRRGDGDVARADPLLQELETLLESAIAYDAAGRAALARGDWAAAEASFRRGLAIVGDDARLRATLHHRLGTARAQVGDVAGATREFERALEADPAHAPAHYSLGLVMLSAGRPDDAMRHLKDALAAQPGLVEARVVLGDLLRQLGRTREALGEYEQVLVTSPADASARFGEAVALARLGRWRDAHRRLTAASTLHPADPALSLALARLLAAAPDDAVRNGSQARSIADTVMRAAPSLDALEVLAMSLAESGEFERAAAVQKDALARAEQTGQRHLLAHFGADLRLYESRRPCRTPWHLEPMYVPPGL